MKATYAEFAKSQKIPGPEELKASLAKRGWTPSEIQKAQDMGLVPEPLRAQAKATEATKQLSALAEEHLLREDARLEGREVKVAKSEPALGELNLGEAVNRRFEALEAQVTALEAEAKKFEAAAAKAENVEEKSRFTTLAEQSRSAQAQVKAEHSALKDLEKTLSNVQKLSEAEMKQSEQLGNEATELMESYLKAKSKEDLDKIVPGLGRFSLREANDAKIPLEKIRDLRKAPLKPEERAQLFSSVREFAQTKQGEKFAEFAKGPDVSKAFSEAHNIGKSGLGPQAERAILESHGLNPHNQALAQAMGISEHSPEPGLLREARVKTAVARADAESKASSLAESNPGKATGRAPTSVERPGPMPSAEIEKELKAAFGEKGKTPLSREEQENLAKAVKGLDQKAIGRPGFLEANAKSTLAKLESLAVQDAEAFQNFKMAVEETNRYLEKNPKAEWRASWEEGVKEMLIKSGFTEEKISEKIDGKFTFLQQTALCLAM